jgi:hypothetical protein
LKELFLKDCFFGQFARLHTHTRVSFLFQFSFIMWKPLYVINLGQRETDNIDRMIRLAKQALWLFDYKNVQWALDIFNLLIKLTE